MTQDWKALCAGLIDALDSGIPAERIRISPLAESARAALAKPEPKNLMQQLAPEPIPVSERLPKPEDCDAEGRCWLGGEMFAPGEPTWVLGFPAWAQQFPEIHRYWLPAHALPLHTKKH